MTMTRAQRRHCMYECERVRRDMGGVAPFIGHADKQQAMACARRKRCVLGDISAASRQDGARRRYSRNDDAARTSVGRRDAGTYRAL